MREIERPFVAAKQEVKSHLTIWHVYALAVLVYVLATLLTDAFFMSDSKDYVYSIIAYQEGRELYFWEFGHLLWRPLGWAMAEVLRPVTSWFVGQSPPANVMLSLVWINLAAGLLSVLCLVYFLSCFCRNRLIIGLISIGFIFSQGVLNYAQTGAPYVTGLAFLLMGLCCMARETTTKRQAWAVSVAAGLSFSLAVGFWFLFIWALPAAILLPLIMRGVNRGRFGFSVAAALSFSTFISLFYLIALALLHITSFAAFKEWVLWAGHGNTVRGISRIVFGVARTFINMGNDGMLVKRFLLGDPYNHVSAWQLVSVSLWKLGLFYAFLLATLWMLWKSEKGIRFLLLLLATAPIFIFAYFFSPGDIERYIPWYPFFFLLVAYAVEKSSAPNWVRLIPALFLMMLVITNTNAMFKPALLQQQEKIAARLGDLPSKMPPQSEVLTVNWQDDLVNFYRSFPLHPLNQRQSFIITSVVTPGIDDNKYWRETFGKKVMKIWSSGGQVWLSMRAFSQRPEADWNWVEGDDRNLFWEDFPAFFAGMDTGEQSGGTDGFRLILPSEKNKLFLQAAIDSSGVSKR